MLLFYFKDDIQTIRGKTRSIPKTFLDYKFLDEINDSRFEIIALHDKNMYELSKEYQLFLTLENNYILQLDERKNYDYQTTLFKIDTDGTIINSLKLPRELHFFRGFLLGKGIYSDWTITNELSIQNAEIQNEKVNKNKFDELYQQASILYGLSEEEYMIQIDNRWYYVQTDFKNYTGDNKVVEGTNLLIEQVSGWPEDFASNKYSVLSEGLEKIPTTLEELTFSFFEKLKYKGSGSSNKIGSSTGGVSWLSAWKGNGYFALKFEQNNFNFKYPILYTEINKNWKYQIPFNIFKADKFSIISTKNSLYLIRLKKQPINE